MHHDYLYYSRFKCNSRKCNHTHVAVKKTSNFDSISSDFKSNTISIKRLRTNINVVIDALYMYFVHSATTRAISQYLLDRKNIKISHVSIYKWIKGFGGIFKDIVSKYTPQNLNLSDEWHVDETVIKIKGKRYYIWTLIDSETRYVIDWYLTKSREAS
ncbi:MAG: DDE-type integrase/transposase/recombinase, partial [Cetobacterium sp.]